MAALKPNVFAGGGVYALGVAVLLNGCVFQPVSPTTEPPQPVETPAPPVAESAPAPRREPAPPAAARPAQVAILLSDDTPSLAAVADQIELRLADVEHTTHNLDGHPANTARILAEVESTHPDQLIAVGLLAAQTGRQLRDVPMVFCSVFNYEDHELISASSKGVALLPPFAMQLKAWKELSPDLGRIGVVSGPNKDALIADMRAATEEAGVELLSRTAYSDQEALYVFKRLTPEIQGLWLLPDNRILSPRAVREIMSYAAKHRIQIVVFGSSLLDLGALMAVESRDSDVAKQVIARLAHRTKDGALTGSDVMPLTQMDLQINPEVARHLGLSLPERTARAEPTR